MNRLLLTLIFVSSIIFAQKINIVPQLKMIEAGNINGARAGLAELKETNPNDPSVLFLDAVLTSNGQIALQKYNSIYSTYPKSSYADAALYRIFSYYYSLGVYNKAENYLTKLKSEYPQSPYIKAADRKIPDIDFDTENDVVSENNNPPPIVKTKPIIHKNYYAVQAGAFLNITNAKSLKDQIEKDGYKVDIAPKDVGGSILNVVLVGNLNSEDEAAQILDYLRTKFKLRGRIVTITSAE